MVYRVHKCVLTDCPEGHFGDCSSCNCSSCHIYGCNVTLEKEGNYDR